MPIESIHPGKRLLASVTSIRPQVQMKRLVTLAIMLTRKALFASRPLALERSLLIMTPEMTFQVEMTSKRASAPRYRAHE